MVAEALDRTKVRTRVVVIDDSRPTAAIDRIVAAEPGFAVVGVADDVEAGISMIARTKPDLVIANLHLSYIHGKILCERLAKFPPMRKVMILSRLGDNSPLEYAFRQLGVDACIDRARLTADPEVLRSGIRSLFASPTQAAAPGAVVDLQLRRSLVTAGARSFPVPLDEHARLQALAAFELANDDEDAQLDRLTAHLHRTSDFPICLMTFVDRDTQWIKSAQGFARGTMPRAEAICNYTLARGTTFSTTDTTRDPRFRHYDAVVNSPHIRTYVGHPIINERGIRLGALCLLDTRSRALAPAVVINLRGMCEIAAGILDARVPRLAKCA